MIIFLYFLLPILTVGLLSPESCLAAEWGMGMEIGWFNAAGNIELEGTGIEFSGNLIRTDETGNWIISLGRFETKLSKSNDRSDLSYSTILIRRSAHFAIKGIQFEMATGGGFAGFGDESGEVELMRGVPYYSVELYLYKWRQAGREVGLGFAYRSGWVPDSHVTLDRLTFILSMRRPFMGNP